MLQRPREPRGLVAGHGRERLRELVERPVELREDRAPHFLLALFAMRRALRVGRGNCGEEYGRAPRHGDGN